MAILQQEDGVKVNFMQVRLMRPFPADEVKAILSRAKHTVLVEENYSGQLGDILRAHTGITLNQRCVKYDGRPFSEEELVEALRKALKSRDQERVAVTHLLP